MREAVLQQLAHYPYHIDHLVHIAKGSAMKEWVSLSILTGVYEANNEAIASMICSRMCIFH